MSEFRIEYLPRVTREDIPALDNSIALRIKASIATKLSKDPYSFGKPLRYSLKNTWTLRVGDWRVFFEVKKQTVTILAIRHRSQAY